MPKTSLDIVHNEDRAQESGLEVVTAGETMLRLSPPFPQHMLVAPSLEVHFGGAEFNFAITLQQLGHQTGWISRVSDDIWGRRLVGELRRFGVDGSHVIFDEQAPLGIMFYQHSANPRPDFVIYNRRHSAASRLSPEDMDWDYVGRARHLHLTGITPALSLSCRKTALKLAGFAKEKGLTLSVDANYRSKLWSTAEAGEVIGSLMQDADLIILTAVDAQQLFNLTGKPQDVCRQAADLFGARNVCLTLGGEGATVYDGSDFYSSQGYDVELVDSIGAGDSFSAGLVHGFLQGDLAAGVKLGSALAALKLTVTGDYNFFDQTELSAVLEQAEGKGGDIAVRR